MTSLIRLYLIFLLVLLQCAAPLIHAHTHNMAHFGASVHLPEFEQVNASPRHAPEFLAPSNQNDEMVAMSTGGIKNETPRILEHENIVVVLLLGLFCIAKMPRQLCSFSSKTEPIPHTYFFNLASPRAPPFLTFR